MRIGSFVLTLAAVGALGAALLAPSAWADYGRHDKHVYARLVGGDGYGFCEFVKTRRSLEARVWATGLQPNSVATAWIFVDGAVRQLDGGVTTGGGDIDLQGELRVRRHVEIKLDVRDHQVLIVDDIGNDPADPIADDLLLEELTKPAPTMIGTCTVDF